jgi:hypothetical protein
MSRTWWTTGAISMAGRRSRPGAAVRAVPLLCGSGCKNCVRLPRGRRCDEIEQLLWGSRPARATASSTSENMRWRFAVRSPRGLGGRLRWYAVLRAGFFSRARPSDARGGCRDRFRRGQRLPRCCSAWRAFSPAELNGAAGEGTGMAVMLDLLRAGRQESIEQTVALVRQADPDALEFRWACVCRARSWLRKLLQWCGGSPETTRLSRCSSWSRRLPRSCLTGLIRSSGTIGVSSSMILEAEAEQL